MSDTDGTDRAYVCDVFRYCPRCGSDRCGSPALKRFVCEACGFHFYTNSATAVAVFLRNARGEVLFIRRAKEPMPGRLALPGGFVDPQESAEDAIVREAREEIQAEVSGLEFLASYPNLYHYRGVTYYTCDLFFTGKAVFPAGFGVNAEVSHVVFLAPEQVREDDLAFESARRALRAYRERGAIERS